MPLTKLIGISNAMDIDKTNRNADIDLTLHVFSISATLVGVCLTVIGIFIMSKRLSHVKSYGEEMLAFDAQFFLASCILSYWSLRMRRKFRRYSIERLAEELFFVGLIFMAFICFFIIYEIV